MLKVADSQQPYDSVQRKPWFAIRAYGSFSVSAFQFSGFQHFASRAIAAHEGNFPPRRRVRGCDRWGWNVQPGGAPAPAASAPHRRLYNPDSAENAPERL